MNGEDVTEAFDWPEARRRLFWAGGLRARIPSIPPRASPPTASRLRVAAHTHIAFVRLAAYSNITIIYFPKYHKIIMSDILCFNLPIRKLEVSIDYFSITSVDKILYFFPFIITIFRDKVVIILSQYICRDKVVIVLSQNYRHYWH